MAFPNANDPLTERIIGFAIEVHRQLGPGLLESAYQECLCFELKEAGIPYRRQVALPVIYKGVRLDCGYRLDIVLENRLIIELKTVERLYRDAPLLVIGEGTNELQRIIIARQLIDRNRV